MSRKILGMMLIGLTIPGLIFTGLIWLGYSGVYGKTGIGEYSPLVPLILTLVMMVIGTVLMLSSKEKIY